MVDFETRETGNGTVIVKLSGQLDQPSCQYVFHNVKDLLDNGRTRIVVDCDNLDQVSGATFEMLVRCQTRIQRRGCQILLTGIQHEFAHLLAWFGVDRLFNVYPTTRRAVRALESRYQLSKA
jgi:anti-anti-sigma factor